MSNRNRDRQQVTVTFTTYVYGDIDEDMIADIEGDLESEFEAGGNLGAEVDSFIEERLSNEGYIQCKRCDGFFCQSSDIQDMDNFTCDGCFAEAMTALEKDIQEKNMRSVIAAFGYPLRVKATDSLGLTTYGDMTQYDSTVKGCYVEFDNGSQWYSKDYVTVVLG